MKNDSGSPIRGDVREAISLLRRASEALRRADKRGDETRGDEDIAFFAHCVIDDVDTVRGDLEDMLEHGEAPIRVKPIATGRPWREDGGGGFGWRALQALAICREAWVGADFTNAQRMERAISWIARAWLETCGYDRARTLTAVLAYGLDRGRAVELLQAVDKAAAEIDANHVRRAGMPPNGFSLALEFEVEFLEARDDDGDRRPADVHPVKRGTPAKGGKVPEPTRRKRRGQKGPLST